MQGTNVTTESSTNSVYKFFSAKARDIKNQEATFNENNEQSIDQFND